jgi:predicted dehydrogenase
VICWADTQVKPIEAEDHAIGMVRYANGAIGQFEVSWTFRGGLDLRDEVMGTEGTVWINNFLRTGLEMFISGKGSNYVAEKAESTSGWIFPVGDEVHELGYDHMFADMFNAIDNGAAPSETFYDGYVVNAIMDAALLSVKSKKWETIDIALWRGNENSERIIEGTDYDEQFYLIKQETIHDGTNKLILKDKKSGKISERVL